MANTIFTPRTWLLGVKSLLLHPLRSLLTVLGIFIGTASVIWLLAVGEGISRKAQEQIAGLGAENIIVRTVKPADQDSAADDFFLAYGLTRDDAQRISDTLPQLKMVRIRELRRRFSMGPRDMEGRLVGCDPEYFTLNSLKMARGRPLTDIDLENEDNVCVLAAGTAHRLFAPDDPIGKSLRIEDDFYRVVGVTRSRNPTAAIGGSLSAQEYNEDVYIPITTLWKRIGDQIYQRTGGTRSGEIVELSQMTLRVPDLELVPPAASLVKRILDPRHPQQDYSIVVPQELLEQAETSRLMFMVLLGLIAAISLVVGGIGIMNIMLATVTERTKEIGIRRALGARRSDITRQFLVETTVLSVAGGLTGILGGLACGPITIWVRQFITESFPEVMDGLPPMVKDMAPVVVPWSIPLAFGISVGVGIVFGLYPALRAAKMDPIQALRHE